MAPTRLIPRGGVAAIARYRAADVPAVVEEVGEDGRRVRVRTHEDESLEFKLNRSTARYQAPYCGPRLNLVPREMAERPAGLTRRGPCRAARRAPRRSCAGRRGPCRPGPP